MKRFKILASIVAFCVTMVGEATAADLVDLPIYRASTALGVWEKETFPSLQQLEAVQGEVLVVEKLLDLQCNNEQWKEVCADRAGLNKRLRERNPILRNETVGLQAFLSVARGNDIFLPVPAGFEKVAFASPPRAHAAAPTGVTAGATPAVAASPAAVNGNGNAVSGNGVVVQKTAVSDPAVNILKELSATVAALRAAADLSDAKKAKDFEAVNAAADRGAKAAERSASAAARTEAAALISREDRDETKAVAASAQASAANANERSLKAVDTAASAAGLAKTAWDQSNETATGLKQLKGYVEGPGRWVIGTMVGLGLVALLAGTGFYFSRQQGKVLHGQFVGLSERVETNTVSIDTFKETAAVRDLRIGGLETDLSKLKKIVRGVPGYTEFADEDTLESRLAGLSLVNPTRACEVTVVDQVGNTQLFNLNFTFVGLEEGFRVQGVRDQGTNPIKLENVIDAVRSAGRQGRILGCDPFVPPVAGPATQPIGIAHRSHLGGKGVQKRVFVERFGPHHGIGIDELSLRHVPAELRKAETNDVSAKVTNS